ncbi:SIR2 family protein [Leifsonia shinshuensis]|uniref:Uncharacterized protein n=1 Tax=Leifsonia shinshuensis TaxID=150026 RepID=A0A7G6YAD1_9MICO|nr:SIR2 family protein [Leifsonia shinshuensis]QNE35446.1 hypothetical protein F1C12_10110 [Leifsonia shinshuensis]
MTSNMKTENLNSAAADEDTLISVSFGLASSPGTYALLVGAGVSKGAGLPSAWDVLVDLTGRVADLKGETPDDPVRWYEETFETVTTYESVLERLAPTTYERQALLRTYFEPNPEEDGSAEPTEAHRAIARLVSEGAVRVIVTLNFDRLIERALREAGIEPLVIASEADIAGMPPLHTAPCCVVHLHGDYLNPPSMLNTVEELSEYGDDRRQLLERILTDYGLIAAGWSAVYDRALREAIKQSYPGRYTLTWIEPGTPGEEATQLRLSKNGVLVQTDADRGFGRLADAVQSMRSRHARHPLTLATAVETAKRELAGGKVSISLHDTIAAEFRRLYELEDIRNPSGSSDSALSDIVARIDEAAEVVDGLIATLAYWGDEVTDRWWIDELPRFAQAGEGSGSTLLLERRLIAGSAMFYTAGVAAVAAQRYGLLRQLFTLTRESQFTGRREPLASCLAIDHFTVNIPEGGRRPYSVVAPILDEAFPVPAEKREQWWQLFEVLRNAALLMDDTLFQRDYLDYAHTRKALGNAEQSRTGAIRLGNSVNKAAAEQRISEAQKSLKEQLREITRLVFPTPVHLRAAMSGERNSYLIPVAEQLAAELAVDGQRHPLIRTGFADEAERLECAVLAVSIKFGELGRETARGRIHSGAGFGVIASKVWLDSVF